MTAPGLIRAREAYARRAWREAHAAYAEERAAGTLTFTDFENHGTTAHLIGDNELSREILAEGYREGIRRGEPTWAARMAFWIGHGLIFDGGMSQAAGWFARARQLLAGRDADCAEAGFVRIPDGVGLMESGDPEAAVQVFREILALASTLGDPQLRAMATFGLGRATIRCGDIEGGMAVLDDVIVAVALGEMPPMVIGDAYCGVLEACHEVLDLRRAREWTGALTAWCEQQPDLVPYRGPCRVYRAEVLQFDGAWVEAFTEAQQACDWLRDPRAPEGPGEAFYRLGEIHRLRAEMAAAEECYRQASRAGRRPEPGNALLLLAQGKKEQAVSCIRRAIREETGAAAPRAMLFDAALRIADAMGESQEARRLADEIQSVAGTRETAALRAIADRALGLAHMLEGEAEAAIGPLRRAWAGWQRLGVPYEAGYTRLLLGRAYEALGDGDAAAMEFDAARWVFTELGALHDLTQLDRLATAQSGELPTGPLTLREREVLALLAEGRTNKEIGVQLVISEHTVARHVQNMLSKLGVASRTALATYAVESGLIPARTTQS